ncbi:MAG: beta-ketoacyl synthase N-terminal-like domain-containing protein, partial [Myxococcota bacterium]
MSESQPVNHPPSSPIAVVGVSALFPGSLDTAGFWRDILAGRDLITDVPPTHWLIDDYYDPDPSAPDKTYARRGAFLEKINFDALGWGVPPSIVPVTDTSQLLALIVAQRVLDDATHGQFREVDRSRISVILGVTSAQELLASMVSRLQRPVWLKSLRESGIPQAEAQAICDRIASHYVEWQESSFPGLLGNVVAGRIANRLDLGGTNCVTDAACASTFSAVAMAANELTLGQSDLVITGGVDTLNDIFMFMCFSKTPALSPTGDCRPFSADADGTLLGEGLGMVALKRLADAERDNDRIYAVLRGFGASSDGRSKSVYAPVSEGQARALRRAYDSAGFDASTVELIEAHGTGTKAGDAAEFEGLRMVFDGSDRKGRQWCALGSVKSQIGHTKAAAGAAGLFKAVMALQHGVLPPTIKVDQPNPNLGIESSPFYLNTRARPWVRDRRHPRRAGASSFGFGGSNFHLALEEYRGDGCRAARLDVPPVHLVILCGASSETVAGEARRHIGVSKTGYVAWLARDTQRRYAADAAVRLAVVASDEADLSAKLESAVRRIEESPTDAFSTPDGTSYGVGAVTATTGGDIAFLFPGQGSQYVDMGADLAMTFRPALDVWDRLADIDLGAETTLHEVVFPRPVFSEEAEQALRSRLTATEWAQPAIGATSAAMLALMTRLEIEPDCVGGHSFGEITALHAAGVLSEDALLRVSRRRGELFAAAAQIPGSMLAVSRPIDEVRALLNELSNSIGADVVVANHNAPAQVVLSGPTEAIEATERELTQRGIGSKRLPVATAFHSPVVSDSTAPFAEFLGGVEISPPRIPVYSNAAAAPYPETADAIRERLAQQIAEPVRFVDQIMAMAAAGTRTFIEVGPGSVLTGLVTNILSDTPHTAVALDRKGRNGVASLALALSRLAAAGVRMRPEGLWQDHRETDNPLERSEPKMTMEISGSNYGKPYPPADGVVPESTPEHPSVRRVEAAVQPAAAAPAPAPEPQPPRSPTSNESQGALAAPPTTTNAEPLHTTPVAGVADAGWMKALTEIQRQTAEAHSAYQHSMAQTHAAFLRTAETGMQGLTAIATGQPMPATAPPSSFELPQPVVAPVAAP